MRVLRSASVSDEKGSEQGMSDARTVVADVPEPNMRAISQDELPNELQYVPQSCLLDAVDGLADVPGLGCVRASVIARSSALPLSPEGAHL
jgi:hypothetical protein